MTAAPEPNPAAGGRGRRRLLRPCRRLRTRSGPQLWTRSGPCCGLGAALGAILKCQMHKHSHREEMEGGREEREQGERRVRWNPSRSRPAGTPGPGGRRPRRPLGQSQAATATGPPGPNRRPQTVAGPPAPLSSRLLASAPLGAPLAVGAGAAAGGGRYADGCSDSDGSGSGSDSSGSDSGLRTRRSGRHAVSVTGRAPGRARQREGERRERTRREEEERREGGRERRETGGLRAGLASETSALRSARLVLKPSERLE